MKKVFKKITGKNVSDSRPGPIGRHQHDVQEYSMERKPRGFCVIINNNNFGDVKTNRKGTDVDRDHLKTMFEKLAFKVKTYDDLSDTKMMEMLRHYAHTIDHTDYDCFVCFILTHGSLGCLYGNNTIEITIKDLTSNFQANKCPSLIGKPKLFFFQACQGNETLGGAMLQKDSSQSLIETDEGRVYVPNTADFLFGYATDAEHVSYRHELSGSWYIRELIHMLELHSQKHDLMSILTQVNQEVSYLSAKEKGSPYIYKQMPAVVFTLTKKVYFR